MYRKCLCVLLCCVIVLSVCLPTYATETVNSDSGIIFTDDSATSPATASQISASHQYLIDFSSLADVSISNYHEVILSYCTLVSSELTGSCTISTYSSSTLASIIPNCKTITEITKTDYQLYISFETIDSKEVIITYTTEGLSELVIYDPLTDTAYYERNGIANVYSNFRSGTSVAISDELLNEINALIIDNDFDSLREIDGLNVNITDDGLVTVEPATNQNARATGFTNESDVLSNLKERFPQYTNSTIKLCYEQSSSLNKSVRIKVTESRNGYVKKTASFKEFGIGTALTLISAFIDRPTDVIIIILDGLGIAVSAVDTILSAVTLYRSATYTYLGERAGFAYDTTVHDNYVRVVTYSDRGTFTGGYNADNEFDWVISDPSTAHDKSSDSIVDTTVEYYDAAIVMGDGCCFYYQPD